MSVSPEETNGDEPARGRGLRPWWLAAIVLVAGIAVVSALTAGETADDAPGVAAPTTTAVTEAPSTTVPSPTTTATTPITTTVPGYEPFGVSGSGDDVFDFSVPDDQATVLTISHAGDGQFSVTTFGESDELVELLVEADGPYQGDRAVNLILNDAVRSIEVAAGGDWEIRARYLGDLERHRDEASGHGDAVVIMDISNPAMEITHSGESDFVVFMWTFQDQGFLVQETGPVEQTVSTPTGGVVIEIIADGDWSLSTTG